MKIICDNCDYEWDFGGKLQQATCPNCGSKVKIKGEVQDERLPGPSRLLNQKGGETWKNKQTQLTG